MSFLSVLKISFEINKDDFTLEVLVLTTKAF